MPFEFNLYKSIGYCLFQADIDELSRKVRNFLRTTAQQLAQCLESHTGDAASQIKSGLSTGMLRNFLRIMAM
ncbi:hypothetical protein [Pseudomonas fluorescens]|uniref:hypothetical protein n=1 Tax=Pseudomonas TaxID=286 RepID=UPI003D05771B